MVMNQFMAEIFQLRFYVWKHDPSHGFYESNHMTRQPKKVQNREEIQAQQDTQLQFLDNNSVQQQKHTMRETIRNQD